MTRYALPPEHPLNQRSDDYVSTDVELTRTGLDEPRTRRRPGKYMRQVLDDYEQRLRQTSRDQDRAFPYLDKDGRWRR